MAIGLLISCLTPYVDGGLLQVPTFAASSHRGSTSSFLTVSSVVSLLLPHHGIGILNTIQLPPI